MPSQLANCVIEVGQCSQSQDYAGWFSLAITVFGWPIVYYLGLRTNRKVEINKSIDQLDDAVENLRKFAGTLESKQFLNSDYQTMVAYFNRVRSICIRIEQLDKKIQRPVDVLRELKKISTDELFHSDQKHTALSKILRVEMALVDHYKKSM
ncbi:hypothetical protein L3Q72_19925 [Vibrio sp. JC009]|uniref:hypothetical protein n=1 Tax=Vibrio sp. JC009 TaxID=2912314 RepID=UPI0023B02DC2|nr:hypothetical protein [Vibrio sp. JC009]WED23511.1 hypothetical protein L3Q72_19925 [Vibrio sp. JC009]